MSFIQKLDRATVLFNGMADRLGADIPGRIAGDAHNVETYRTALLRCAACKSPEACAGWQIEHDSAEAAPGYCRNRRTLEALASS